MEACKLPEHIQIGFRTIVELAFKLWVIQRSSSFDPINNFHLDVHEMLLWFNSCEIRAFHVTRVA